MGATGAYLTAVVAGAMTAGIGAANVMAVPPDQAVPVQRDVWLAAEPITIPIIDIGPTPGPLSVWRYLALQAGTNPLLLGLDQKAGNTYNLPGLYTLVNSTANPRVQADSGPDYLDFAFLSDRSQEAQWKLLGDVVTSDAGVNGARAIHFTPLLGGSEGIGAGLSGFLDQTAEDKPITRSLTILGSGFESTSDRQTGVFDGALALKPFNGFKAVGGGTLVDGNNTTTANLGGLQLGAGSDGALGGGAGLCVGSSKGTKGCESQDTAFAGFDAPINVGLGTGGSSTNVFSVKFPQNNLAVAVGNGRFGVKGQLGGTVSVGGVTVGRPIDVDFQIPRAASALSSRQSQSVTNQSASTGRHAARDAVNSAVSDVRTAVKNVVSKATQSKPKHAKDDASED